MDTHHSACRGCPDTDPVPVQHEETVTLRPGATDPIHSTPMPIKIVGKCSVEIRESVDSHQRAGLDSDLERRVALLRNWFSSRKISLPSQNGEEIVPFKICRPDSNTETLGVAGMIPKTQQNTFGLNQNRREDAPPSKSKSRSKSGKRRFRWGPEHAKLLEDLVRSHEFTMRSADKQLVCGVFPGFSERYIKSKLKQAVHKTKVSQGWTIHEDSIIFKFLLKGATDWSKVQELYFPLKTQKEVCERVDSLRRSQLKKIANLGKRDSVSPNLSRTRTQRTGKCKVKQSMPEKNDRTDSTGIDSTSRYKTLSTCHTALTCVQQEQQLAHKLRFDAQLRLDQSEPQVHDPVILIEIPQQTDTTDCRRPEKEIENRNRPIEIPVVSDPNLVSNDFLSDLPRLGVQKHRPFSFEVPNNEDLLTPKGTASDELWMDGASFSRILATNSEDSWLGWNT